MSAETMADVQGFVVVEVLSRIVNGVARWTPSGYPPVGLEIASVLSNQHIRDSYRQIVKISAGGRADWTWFPAWR
ncbi:MAG: hypothetical protein ABI947_22070 [Chloroflexota bacterium]